MFLRMWYTFMIVLSIVVTVSRIQETCMRQDKHHTHHKWLCLWIKSSRSFESDYNTLTKCRVRNTLAIRCSSENVTKHVIQQTTHITTICMIAYCMWCIRISELGTMHSGFLQRHACSIAISDNRVHYAKIRPNWNLIHRQTYLITNWFRRFFVSEHAAYTLRLNILYEWWHKCIRISGPYCIQQPHPE